jgi:hypothetical protein
MRTRFASYLQVGGLIDESAAQGMLQGANEFREVIGALALKHQLLTPAAVDEVLAAVTAEHPFGEVACRLGHLTPAQVETLVSIQQLQEVMDVGHYLMLHHGMSRSEVPRHAHAFLGEVGKPAVCEEAAP